MAHGPNFLRAAAALLAVTWAVPALAVDMSPMHPLGIGLEAGPTPALSVQYAVAPQTAYHVTAHVDGGGAALSADYQRLHVPSIGYGHGWTASLYGGLGLSGTGDRENATESFRVRLPLGVQCDVNALRLSIFMEGAALVGPLPLTGMSATGAAGLRARF
jgi:hypothetical protein